MISTWISHMVQLQ